MKRGDKITLRKEDGKGKGKESEKFDQTIGKWTGNFMISVTAEKMYP